MGCAKCECNGELYPWLDEEGVREMSKLGKHVTVVCVLAFAITQTASAILLGSNITIPDLDPDQTAAGWWGPQEDDEVSPGSTTGQNWDLEAFFLNGSALTMVGGYDFLNGEGGYSSGDIFIDINGDAEYGAPANTGSGSGGIVTDTFGYDYVLDLDFSNIADPRYTVIALNAQSRTRLVTFGVNEESNPWAYMDGGEVIPGWVSLSLTSWEDLPDSEVDGLSGGNHNALAFDLSFLTAGTEFTSHFTMECGNDNLMGRARVADGGTTLLLLGCALLGVEGLRRKFSA